MITVAPIVEGYGEVESLRILIERVWPTLGRSDWPTVLQPIRQPKGKLLQPKELERATNLAALKLGGPPFGDKMILLIIDADDDCAAELGPSLLAQMAASRSDCVSACCIAVVEYETWFAASAESMTDLLDLGEAGAPGDPHVARPRVEGVLDEFRDRLPRVGLRPRDEPDQVETVRRLQPDTAALALRRPDRNLPSGPRIRPERPAGLSGTSRFARHPWSGHDGCSGPHGRIESHFGRMLWVVGASPGTS